MDLINILIIGFAVLIILLLWGIAGVRHFRHLRNSIIAQWDMVLESLNIRHDLLPNLVETVRGFGSENDELIGRLIKERALASRERKANARKLEYEHDLSISINKVMDLRKSLQDLKQDTNFLELKKDLSDNAQAVELAAKQYNEMVRYYNKHRKAFFLIPIAKIFGFGNMNIFDVEL